MILIQAVIRCRRNLGDQFTGFSRFKFHLLVKMPARISESSLLEGEDIIDLCSLVSINGFLPARQPLKRLPHPYYQPWEHMLDSLPTLLRQKTFRQEIDTLNILTASRLDTEREWQRAYMILSFLTHGYIWGGDAPSDVHILTSHKESNRF